MYTHYGANVKTRFDIPSQHSYVTANYGSSCSTLGSPYINDCDFNSAQEAFSSIIEGIKNGTE